MHGAFVVKGSRSIASEAFSLLLGLQIGVVAPQWRILTVMSPEGVAFVDRMRAVDVTEGVVVKLFAQTHLLIMSYIRGRNLSQLGAWAPSVFGTAGALTSVGKERLRELGLMLLLDVLLNNGDRLPLIWKNRGNPGNVMFSGKDGRVVR